VKITIRILPGRDGRAGRAACVGTGATADTNDDTNVSALAANNIASAQGPADLIQIGRHEICDAISPSVSPAMLENDVYRESLAGRIFTRSVGGSHAPITTSQAGIVVHDAVIAYCPDSAGAVYWGVRLYPHSPEGRYGTCKEGGACW
jgi:hypothetical protein